MSAIQITWSNAPKENLKKHGELKCGHNYYFVEIHQNENVTISNRADMSKVQLPFDIRHLAVMNKNNAIIMNCYLPGQTGRFVLYANDIKKIDAQDISNTLQCDPQLGVEIASMITVA